MSKKDELLYNINDKISELHQSHFFGGKKKKEINNFGIGILLGIGLSLIVEAGISFWVGIEKFNYIGKELAVNNLSISNLSFMEQVEYKNLFFSDLNLALIVILGCFISSLVIFLYVNINKNLFNHKVIYSYKFKKDKSMPLLAKKIRIVFKCLLKEDKKLGGSIDYDLMQEKIKIRLYNKWKLITFQEYPNIIVITKDKISISCQNSNFGETFGYFIEDFFFNKLKKEFFIKLNREIRT